MDNNSKIYIAGHTGLVGSSILRNLQKKGYTNFVFTSYPQYDLTDQQTVRDFFEKEKPDYVFLAAAKVGGIVANNTYRAQFIYENLQIQNNIIHQSYVHGVKKLLFLGSSCIYPKNAPQPLKEEYLLTSELEYTNEPYAIAKIAGIKMCESYNIQYGTNFICVMPTNLYGPNDNYNLETSHVLPALIRKFHLGKCLEQNNMEAIRKDLNKRPIEGINGDAKEKDVLNILAKYGLRTKDKNVEIELWGSGSPRREFLHTDDLSDACVFLMENIDFSQLVTLTSQPSHTTSFVPRPSSPIINTHINIGTGTDLTIKELAEMVKNITGFKGKIRWNTEKPDGTMQKLMNVDKLHALGWKETISLLEGIERVYRDYVHELHEFC
ncbi:MAG: GDP-L-fucose synthase [Bacteroidales bacterium]|nr:GDP-L-fucose synthase [Bacteroidales bacterium]